MSEEPLSGPGAARVPTSSTRLQRAPTRTASAVAVAFLVGVVLTSAVQSDDGDRPSTVASGVSDESDSVTPGAPLGTTDTAGTDVASPDGQAAPEASGAPGGSPTPAATPGAPAPTGAAKPGVAAPTPAAGNGGATFRGVTDKVIRIGFANADTNTIGAACPRCGNGEAANNGYAEGLLAAWRRDGLLPIYGRDIQPVARKFDILSAEGFRNACLQLVEEKVFMVVAIGLGTIGECLAKEFKVLGVSGVNSANEEQQAQMAPYFFQTDPTRERIWRNYAHWLHQTGQLKGQVIGLYSPADDVTQGEVTKNFRNVIKQLGYTVKTDVVRDGAETDAIAVQRFRADGVTTALLLAVSPVGFQGAAEQLGYRPKYPLAEVASEMTDAVADISYVPDAQNGNLGMKKEWWEFSQRKPAVPHSSNAKAVYCLKAYQEYTKRTLDVWDNDAEIHSVKHGCSALEATREALVKAGPNLTLTSVVQGFYQISGLQVSDYLSVSFGPGKYAGNDTFANAQYKKERWPIHNNYWGTTSPWQQYFVK